MNASTTPSSSPRRRSRRWLTIAAAIAIPALVAIFVVFEPHKLFIDDKVNETVPEGFVLPGEPKPTSPPSDPTEPAASEPVGSEPAGSEPTGEPAVQSTPPVSVPQASPFQSLDHPTSGDAYVLVDAQGNRILRFENLQTDNGPDLKVYLSTAPADGSGDFDAVAVNLGDLKGNQGSQNYEIPADIDLSQYQSVVIWCDRFDVAFGAAPLPVG